jgi:hypothetical protein
MYIENKGGEVVGHTDRGPISSGAANLTGAGRIGRVTFSKTGKSLIYNGKLLERANSKKANYICKETGEWFWVSGPKQRGGDALYATNITTKIDEDVREEYWTEIRNLPDRVKESETL